MSADPRTLARFRIEGGDDAFLLVLEDASGEAHRFAATDEQLDVLADLIDDALGTASED